MGVYLAKCGINKGFLKENATNIYKCHKSCSGPLCKPTLSTLCTIIASVAFFRHEEQKEVDAFILNRMSQCFRLQHGLLPPTSLGVVRGCWGKQKEKEEKEGEPHSHRLDFGGVPQPTTAHFLADYATPLRLVTERKQQQQQLHLKKTKQTKKHSHACTGAFAEEGEKKAPSRVRECLFVRESLFCARVFARHESHLSRRGVLSWFPADVCVCVCVWL